MEAPKQAIIFLLSGVGDSLMFTPALRLLRSAWSDTKLVALTMRASERDALACSPDLDEVRFWPFLRASRLSTLRYLAGLRRERFDLSLLPCPSNRIQYNTIAFLVGATNRIAFRYLHQSRRNLDFLNTQLHPHHDNVHNVEHNVAIVESLVEARRDAFSEWSPQLRLITTTTDQEVALAFLAQEQLSNRPCIGLHVSSSRAKRMDRKCWPTERFLDFIRRLHAQNPEFRFVLFCGEEDTKETSWLRERCGPELHVAFQLPLRTAAEVIRSCRVFVTNDSGMLHVACAVRTPTVAIFGPTNPRRTGPWNAPAHVVRADLPCSPCFYHTSHDLTCPAGLDFACLRDISVTRVQHETERMLARGRADG